MGVQDCRESKERLELTVKTEWVGASGILTGSEALGSWASVWSEGDRVMSWSIQLFTSPVVGYLSSSGDGEEAGGEEDKEEAVEFTFWKIEMLSR